MNEYKLRADHTAVSKEESSQKEPKANRIVIGVDVHLKSYQAARKIDNGAVGVVQTFRSKEALMLYVEKQREEAKEVAAGYVTGPPGVPLQRALKASEDESRVCTPRMGAAQRERRTNNTSHARTLTSDSFTCRN